MLSGGREVGGKTPQLVYLCNQEERKGVCWKHAAASYLMLSRGMDVGGKTLLLATLCNQKGGEFEGKHRC